MSKRHRKSKEFQSKEIVNDGNSLSNDFEIFEAPKGKKLKGRDRRKSIKRSFLDD